MDLCQQLELRLEVRVCRRHTWIASNLELLVVRLITDRQADAIRAGRHLRSADGGFDHLVGGIVVLQLGGIRIAQVPNPAIESGLLRNTRLLVLVSGGLNRWVWNLRYP